MNSKLFIFVSCFFLFSQVQSQTDQNSFELLKDLYLKKFVKDAAKTSFDSWVVDLEVDAVEFKADYIHEKDRVNLRLGYGERELLLHMFEDFQEPSSTLQNHDIAHHLQVFQTKNAPHLYSQVFPNATILGEVYGAYQLLNGA